MKQVIKYETFDGKLFDEKSKAEAHEADTLGKEAKLFTQFTQVCYGGRKLLEKHHLNERGVWQVFGEDPNCDFAGSHHQPNLGVFEGRLEDVIKVAVKMPNFWTWGGGGTIERIGIKRV